MGRFRIPGWLRSILRILSVVLVIVGLAGLPDDIRRWAGWIDALDADTWRWTFVIGGVMIFVALQLLTHSKTEQSALTLEDEVFKLAKSRARTLSELQTLTGAARTFVESAAKALQAQGRVQLKGQEVTIRVKPATEHDQAMPITPFKEPAEHSHPRLPMPKLPTGSARSRAVGFKLSEKHPELPQLCLDLGNEIWEFASRRQVERPRIGYGWDAMTGPFEQSAAVGKWDNVSELIYRREFGDRVREVRRKVETIFPNDGPGDVAALESNPHGYEPMEATAKALKRLSERLRGPASS